MFTGTHLLLFSLALCLCVQESFSKNSECKSSDCVIKCCPKNQISRVTYDDEDEHRECVDSYGLTKNGVKNPDDYSDIGVYNKDIQRKVIRTNKRVNDFRFQYVTNFTQGAECFSYDNNYETYLLENGKWTLRLRNYWNQWTIFEPGQFCIEHEVSMYDGSLESLTPSVVVWITMPFEEGPSNRRALTSAYGLMVSCVFLLLVLAVYALLPELRNLAGLILMALLSTYFAFFFIRIIQVLGNENEILSTNGCVTLTVIFHYLMLATFCWMNVMSFDIWWKFRRVRKFRDHRRGVMYKFRWYCLYAWGLPVLTTLFVVIVDRLDLRHLPNFVQPHLFTTCYFETHTHLLYVSVPISILIGVNLILFLMSAYNIWQMRRGIDNFKYDKDSANNQKNEHRLWVYLRLSILMGVSWILEVIGNLVNTESAMWIISDMYNALIGLFIFLLFVCKKKIYRRLCERFSINDSQADDAPTKSATHTDTSDVEHWTPSYKEIKNKSEQI